MRATGRSRVEIATVIRERYRGVTPRAALRMAHGWTWNEVAEAWTKRWPDDPKTFKNISRWEVLPAGSGHAPPHEVLNRLAELYQCRVSDLLADQADFRHLDGAHQALPEPAASERVGPLGVADGVVASPEAGTALALPAATAAWEEVVAQQSMDFATRARRSAMDPMVLERLEAELRRIAWEHRHSPRPRAHFVELVGVRDRVFRQIESTGRRRVARGQPRDRG